MDRRQFLAATAAAGFSAAAFSQPRLIRPPRLRRGDRVGLVSPATAAFERGPEEIRRAALEALGLEVEFGGEDEARASDINRFFADPAIRMIFARGGWGSARVLPLLDYELIAANPKVLLGYSDATALINGVHTRTGLVTFHGPSPLDRFSARYFERVIMNGEAAVMQNLVEIDDDKLVQTEHRLKTLAGGKARGPLYGGNLTVLTAIMASPYLPDFDGAILFLEDVNEAVYRVDRMMTELKLAGVLDRIAGFVFGRCTECGPGTNYGSLTLEDVLEQHIRPLGIPAFNGSMIGHIDQQFTLPLGIDVEIDADAGTMKMLEPAVELIGFGALPVAGAAMALALTDGLSPDVRTLLLYAVAVIGGCGEGAVLAWFQLRVLRDVLPDIDARRWVLYTAAAAGGAWALGMLAPTLDDLFGISAAAQLAIWLPARLTAVVMVLAAAASTRTLPLIYGGEISMPDTRDLNAGHEIRGESPDTRYSRSPSKHPESQTECATACWPGAPMTHSLCVRVEQRRGTRS